MVRWNGEEQALHVLLDLVKKIFKSAKVIAKKLLQLVFHNSIFKNILNMSGPNVCSGGTRFRARRWWRTPCVITPNGLPVVNNITSHDVEHWLRSVLLERQVLWIIEQLRRQNQSRVSHYRALCLYQH